MSEPNEPNPFASLSLDELTLELKRPIEIAPAHDQAIKRLEGYADLSKYELIGAELYKAAIGEPSLTYSERWKRDFGSLLGLFSRRDAPTVDPVKTRPEYEVDIEALREWSRLNEKHRKQQYDAYVLRDLNDLAPSRASDFAILAEKCRVEGKRRAQLIDMFRTKLIDQLVAVYNDNGEQSDEGIGSDSEVMLVDLALSFANYMSMRCWLTFDIDSSTTVPRMKMLPHDLNHLIDRFPPKTPWSEHVHYYDWHLGEDGAIQLERLPHLTSIEPQLARHPLLMFVPLVNHPRAWANNVFAPRTAEGEGRHIVSEGIDMVEAGKTILSHIESALRNNLQNSSNLAPGLTGARSDMRMMPLYVQAGLSLYSSSESSVKGAEAFAYVIQHSILETAPYDWLKIISEWLARFALIATAIGLIFLTGGLSAPALLTLSLFASDVALMTIDGLNSLDALMASPAASADDFLAILAPELDKFSADQGTGLALGMFGLSTLFTLMGLREFGPKLAPRSLRYAVYKATTPAARRVSDLALAPLQGGEVSLVPNLSNNPVAAQHGVGYHPPSIAPSPSPSTTRPGAVSGSGPDVRTTNNKNKAATKEARSLEDNGIDVPAAGDQYEEVLVQVQDANGQIQVKKQRRLRQQSTATEARVVEQPPQSWDDDILAETLDQASLARNKQNNTSSPRSGATTENPGIAGTRSDLEEPPHFATSVGSQNPAVLARAATIPLYLYKAFDTQDHIEVIAQVDRMTLLEPQDRLGEWRHLTKGMFGMGWPEAYQQFKELIGVPARVPKLREVLGYLDKLVDKTAILEHWIKVELARRVEGDEVIYEYKVMIDDEEKWITGPIHYGHVLDVVVYSMFVYMVESQAMEMVAKGQQSADWYEEVVYFLRKDFMSSVHNWVPERAKDNLRKGGQISLSYRTQITAREALTLRADKEFEEVPVGGTPALESFKLVVEKLAGRFDMPILIDFQRELRQATAGNLEAIEHLNNYRPVAPSTLTPSLFIRQDSAIGVDVELLQELADLSVRDVIDRKHKQYK